MKLSLSKNLSNSQLADILDFIAQVLILKEDNLYRIRAYENAANSIRHLEEDVEILIEQKANLEDIPNIGKTLADKMVELHQTGNIQSFQKLVQDLPAGMLPLTKIHSIGPKKAFKLATNFHLDNADSAIEELIKHVKAGDVAKLEGFAEKSQQDLLQALEREHQLTSRIEFTQANSIADKIVTELKSSSSIIKVEKLGSLRREEKTIGDLDFGIVITDLEQAKGYIEQIKSIKYVLSAGDNMISMQTANGIQVDVKISPAEEWGSFLQHFTGSKTHNILLRKFALKKGYSLSEHGIKEIGGEKKTYKFSDEKKFYQFLGLNWIPPQERNGGTELEQYKI